jgi:very-short-patch-repair endonuclease
MVLEAASSFSRRQQGLVTRAQLRPSLTDHQIDGAVERRRLEVVFPGVYRVGGAPTTLEQRILAACLAGGATARASFECAASLWEIDGFRPGAVVITVDRARRVRLPGVIVHQSTVPDHVTLRSGIPAASVARTLCDLTAAVHDNRVERAVDDCLRRRLVTLPELHLAYESLAGRGRRRSTVMRSILDWRGPEHQPGESPGEVRLVQLLRGAGLPRPAQQHEVRANGRTLRIDLAYPDAHIAIEFDGWTYHSSRHAFDNDRARANELEVLGWTVLRFTTKSSDLVVVQTVRAALVRAGVIPPAHARHR